MFYVSFVFAGALRKLCFGCPSLGFRGLYTYIYIYIHIHIHIYIYVGFLLGLVQLFGWLRASGLRIGEYLDQTDSVPKPKP